MKVTKGGGSTSNAAIFESKPSSSQLACPSGAPTASASALSEKTYLAIDSVSVDAVPGTKRFTPNGSRVAAVTAAISAVMAAAVL